MTAASAVSVATAANILAGTAADAALRSAAGGSVPEAIDTAASGAASGAAGKIMSFPDEQPEAMELDDYMHYLDGVPDFTDANVPPPPPVLVTRFDAEKHVFHLARIERQCAADAEQVKALQARWQRWLKRRQELADRQRAWHEAGLHAWMVNNGTKTLDLVNGTVRVVKGQPKVVIEDEKAFVETADPQFVRTKVTREPDKKAIAQFIKDTGEIPDGTDWVVGDDHVTVKVKE